MNLLERELRSYVLLGQMSPAAFYTTVATSSSLGWDKISDHPKVRVSAKQVPTQMPSRAEGGLNVYKGRALPPFLSVKVRELGVNDWEKGMDRLTSS